MRTIEEIKAEMETAIEIRDALRMNELYNEEALYYIKDIPICRLREICNAEREGRCVVLPCKVGDDIFSFDWNIKSEKYDIRAGKVKTVRYESSDGLVTVSDGERYCVFGKKVFLARQAAEQALKEREGNG